LAIASIFAYALAMPFSKLKKLPDWFVVALTLLGVLAMVTLAALIEIGV